METAVWVEAGPKILKGANSGEHDEVLRPRHRGSQRLMEGPGNTDD